MSMKLTKNFSLEELTASSTAKARHIDNTPSKQVIENLTTLCLRIMQPIRDKWGDSIIVSSGYRCSKLNSAVGGAKNSSHLRGNAVDFSAKDKSKNAELFRMIELMLKTGEIECRQLIWEYGSKKNPRWIHIGNFDEATQYRKNLILYYYD